MNDNEAFIAESKAGAMKTIIFLIVVILIVVGVCFVIFRKPAKSHSSTTNSSNTTKVQTTTGPDKVKSTSGANGDTVPSSNGAGRGSDTSLLGQ